MKMRKVLWCALIVIALFCAQIDSYAIVSRSWGSNQPSSAWDPISAMEAPNQLDRTEGALGVLYFGIESAYDRAFEVIRVQLFSDEALDQANFDVKSQDSPGFDTLMVYDLFDKIDFKKFSERLVPLFIEVITLRSDRKEMVESLFLHLAARVAEIPPIYLNDLTKLAAIKANDDSLNSMLRQGPVDFIAAVLKLSPVLPTDTFGLVIQGLTINIDAVSDATSLHAILASDSISDLTSSAVSGRLRARLVDKNGLLRLAAAAVLAGHGDFSSEVIATIQRDLPVVLSMIPRNPISLRNEIYSNAVRIIDYADEQNSQFGMLTVINVLQGPIDKYWQQLSRIVNLKTQINYRLAYLALKSAKMLEIDLLSDSSSDCAAALDKK